LWQSEQQKMLIAMGNSQRQWQAMLISIGRGLVAGWLTQRVAIRTVVEICEKGRR